MGAWKLVPCPCFYQTISPIINLLVIFTDTFLFWIFYQSILLVLSIVTKKVLSKLSIMKSTSKFDWLKCLRDHPFKTSAIFRGVGGSKIAQIWQRIVVKYCQTEGGRGHKLRKFADVLNGWSLMIKSTGKCDGKFDCSLKNISPHCASVSNLILEVCSIFRLLHGKLPRWPNILFRICSKSTYASCKCILHLQIVRIWETNFRF